MAKILMTEQEYHEHVDAYDGVCLSCKEVRYGNTEGDAENYDCESCGKKAVMGIELALVAGHIDFVEEEEAPESDPLLKGQ